MSSRPLHSVSRHEAEESQESPEQKIKNAVRDIEHLLPQIQIDNKPYGKQVGRKVIHTSRSADKLTVSIRAYGRSPALTIEAELGHGPEPKIVHIYHMSNARDYIHPEKPHPIYNARNVHVGHHHEHSGVDVLMVQHALDTLRSYARNYPVLPFIDKSKIPKPANE